MELDTLYYRLKSLTVFRPLLSDPVLAEALELLRSLRKEKGKDALEHWAELVSLLQSAGAPALGPWLWEALLALDNPWGRLAEEGRTDPALASAACRDYEALAALAGDFDAWEALGALLGDAWEEVLRDLPAWQGEPLPPFETLGEEYRKEGCGPFARCRAFLWAGRKLVPVPHPDAPGTKELMGYRRQRRQVEDNTRALLAGKRVNNILLFGDSGTGKSATVKSLLSLPRTGDLRLIEVEKTGVASMPELMRTLSGRRQKFILFLDDLSFDKDDLNYSVLKTILEGGLEPHPDNTAIYATSNRRNLVRQTISDRQGDEMDLSETIQEKTALADRFGLRIPYLSLTKAEYLELVDALAKKARVRMEPEALHAAAMAWDVRHPGRSPRSAHQFIASLGV